MDWLLHFKGGQRVNRKGWFALVAAWGWVTMAPASALGSGFALYEAGARSIIETALNKIIE